MQNADKEIKNKELITNIRNSSNPEDILKLKSELFQNNLGLAYHFWHNAPHYHLQEVEEVFGYVWIIISENLEVYDITKSDFAYWLTITLRAQIQKDFNYNGKLIHVPLMKRDIYKPEISDIDLENETILTFNDFKTDLTENSEMFIAWLEKNKKEVLLKVVKLFLEGFELIEIGTLLDMDKRTLYQTLNQTIKRFRELKKITKDQIILTNKFRYERPQQGERKFNCYEKRGRKKKSINNICEEVVEEKFMVPEGSNTDNA